MKDKKNLVVVVLLWTTGATLVCTNNIVLCVLAIVAFWVSKKPLVNFVRHNPRVKDFISE